MPVFQNGRTVQSPYVRKGGLRCPQPPPPPPRFLMLGWQTSMQACAPPNPRFFRACSPYREAFRHRGIIPSGACTPPNQQPPRFFKSRACLPHIAACGRSVCQTGWIVNHHVSTHGGLPPKPPASLRPRVLVSIIHWQVEANCLPPSPLG